MIQNESCRIQSGSEPAFFQVLWATFLFYCNYAGFEVYSQISRILGQANLLDALRVECWSPPLPAYQNLIYIANRTLYLNGRFSEDKDFRITRLPVYYMPDASQLVKWLSFLDDLLEPDDSLTLQEYMGYCFIPSTKGQKILIITGKGGEVKSRIGLVMRSLLGKNMNTGSIAEVETNLFARADLEHELLLVDDDMNLETLNIKHRRTAYELGEERQEKLSRAVVCSVSGLGQRDAELTL